MGDRSQVHIEDSDVWLYTHWGGTGLPQVVQDALGRGERWNDYEYLTRIIFSEMVRGSLDSATGYGIGSAQHGDVYRVIHIDCDAGEVVVENGVAAWHDEGDVTRDRYTFDEFVEAEDVGWP